MLTAITRGVSPSIARCELTYLERQPIDFDKAREQHDRYEAVLKELGATVISLPVELELPDSVFVEDPAIVVPEVAIMTRMGAESRRPESASVAEALSRFRPVRWMREPATIEGGDVFRVGKRFFVGLSSRTNRQGIQQLANEVRPFGYVGTAVEVRGCLHLKSAACPLGGDRVLANRAWLDEEALSGLEIVDVAEGEESAANVLAVGQTVLVASCFPRTAEILDGLGMSVRMIDNSELMKAEGALTCGSLLLE